MSGQSKGTISAIYRYPIKGLTAEALESVELSIGETLPFDRAYAIENGPGRFNPSNPQHLPKVNFLMLMRNQRLATLISQFDSQTHTLTILREGKPVATGNLNTPTGRAIITQFLSAYFASDLRGAPRIVAAPEHSFSDVADKCLHIINLASVRDLGRVTGKDLNPLRFRPNIVIDTGTAWEELNWPGNDIALGQSRLAVFKTTERCAAINVNPSTGSRDTDLLAHLARNWGHTNFGVYAKVAQAAPISVNAPVTVYDSN